MSSLYVRQLCDQWAQATALAEGLPYYNTINEEQKPTDPAWFSLEYQATGNTQATYCSTWETGVVSLIILGEAGVGFQDALIAGQAVVDEFLTNVDPAGRLTLELPQPPSDFSGLDDPWYTIEFAITYTLR